MVGHLAKWLNWSQLCLDCMQSYLADRWWWSTEYMQEHNPG